MLIHYILEGKNPVPCESLLEWAAWLSNNQDKLYVANDTFSRGEINVSTVFLGTDHSFFGKGPPILFETMIFGGPMHEYQRRYSTWEEAEKGHKEACRLVVERN